MREIARFSKSVKSQHILKTGVFKILEHIWEMPGYATCYRIIVGKRQVLQEREVPAGAVLQLGLVVLGAAAGREASAINSTNAIIIIFFY